MVVLVGLGFYLAAFFACSLPSLGGARRWEFFSFLILPDELARSWLGTPPEFSLFDRLPVLAIAGIITACAFGLGRLLLAAVRADQGMNRLEIFVFAGGVGFNAMSTFVLAAGLSGLLEDFALFAILAALILAMTGWFYWQRLSRPSEHVQARTVVPKHGDGCGFGTRWLWLAVPFVAVIVLGAMLPPIEFDVREYHLQAPKEFYQQGRITFLPHNAYANMALGIEMLSLLGMILARDWWLGALAGKAVIALYAPLGALMLLAAGRRFFTPSAGVLAAVLYLSTPWIVQVSTVGFVEGASAYYLFAALYAVLLYWKVAKRPHPARANGSTPLAPREDEGNATPSRTLLLLAGYLAGSAAATKYPAVLFVVCPLAMCVLSVEVLRARSDAAGLRFGLVDGAFRGLLALTLFLLAVALGCGLWFGKNWVLTGNPTYPLMYGLFGGRTLTAEKAALWNQVHLPHDFTIAALKYDMVRVFLGSEWLGPLLMPLAALAFVRREDRRLAMGLWAYFGLVIAAWWLVALRADRHWISPLPLVALAAGAGACWDRTATWRGWLAGLVIVSSAWCFLLTAAIPGPGGYNRYFVSLQRLRIAPERVDPWHRYFNQHVTGGRVLLVGDAEVFDLEVPALYNTWLDDSIFESLVKGRTRAEVRDAFRRENITYVYVDWATIRRYRNTGYGRMDFVQPEVFERLVNQGVLKPLPPIDNHDGRGYRVAG